MIWLFQDYLGKTLRIYFKIGFVEVVVSIFVEIVWKIKSNHTFFWFHHREKVSWGVFCWFCIKSSLDQIKKKCSLYCSYFDPTEILILVFNSVKLSILFNFSNSFSVNKNPTVCSKWFQSMYTSGYVYLPLYWLIVKI